MLFAVAADQATNFLHTLSQAGAGLLARLYNFVTDRFLLGETSNCAAEEKDNDTEFGHEVLR